MEVAINRTSMPIDVQIDHLERMYISNKLIANVCSMRHVRVITRVNRLLRTLKDVFERQADILKVWSVIIEAIVLKVVYVNIKDTSILLIVMIKDNIVFLA